jgi:hypothetical protein
LLFSIVIPAPAAARSRERRTSTEHAMILTIGCVLLVVWFLGFMLMRKVLGGIIHLLLIIGVAAIVWHFVGPMLK